MIPTVLHEGGNNTFFAILLVVYLIGLFILGDIYLDKLQRKIDSNFVMNNDKESKNIEIDNAFEIIEKNEILDDKTDAILDDGDSDYGSVQFFLEPYNGNIIELKNYNGQTIKVGRSDTNSDIVINNNKLSRIHCLICFDKELQLYKVKDISMNGVFIFNGNRLEFGKENIVPRQTMLYLVEEKNCLKLI